MPTFRYGEWLSGAEYTSVVDMAASEGVNETKKKPASQVPYLVKLAAAFAGAQALIQISLAIWFLSLLPGLDTATQGSPLPLAILFMLTGAVVGFGVWGFPHQVRWLWGPVITWNMIFGVVLIAPLLTSIWWMVLIVEVVVLGLGVLLVLPEVRDYVRGDWMGGDITKGEL